MTHSPEDFDREAVDAFKAMRHPEINPDPIPDRTAVEALLARFAQGSAEPEVLNAMRFMARCLLAASQDVTLNTPARRADAILKASGLHGKLEHHRAFVSYVDALVTKLGYSTEAAIKDAQNAGLANVDATTARKRIDRARKKS